MGKTVIKEDMFPEIISHYNTGGRKAADALLRERYGILHPAGVVRRIKKDGRYGYDEVKDRFEDYPACGESGEGLFLGIEELCALSPAAPAPGPAAGKHAGLEKLVQEYAVEEDVVFVGRVSEAEANRYVHFADCAYLSFANNKLFNLTLPAKLQTYLACGAPILAAAGGDSAELINTERCGIAVSPELEKLVSEVKTMVATSAQERAEMAKAARSYYDTHFTMDSLVDQLIDMMNSSKSNLLFAKAEKGDS